MKKTWMCLRCMVEHEIKAGKVLCPLEAVPMKYPTQEQWLELMNWLRDHQVDISPGAT